MQYVYEKPDNLVDWFERGVDRFQNNQLFGTKNQDGEYEWLSYSEVGTMVDNCRAGLAAIGIEKGDTVGFIGNNRYEWAVSAFATYGRGARFVPMYEYEKPHTWKFIIEHSETKLLIVSKREIAEQVAKLTEGSPFLKQILIIDDNASENSYANLLETGKSTPIESYKPSANEVAALIYTSGTTGEPKGVLLSHGNFTHDARAGYLFYTKYLVEKSTSLSILPWAHSYGQVAELYNWIQFGGSIGFMEKVDTLADDMMKIRPTFLLAVPRVFNKIYDGLHRRMAETGGIAEKLFNWAVEKAKKKRELKEAGKSSLITNLQYKIGDQLVFSKIRKRFGGRLEGALTASAMMSPEINNFFWDIGIPIAEGYGLTETSPAIAMNRFEDFRIGSIGKPLKDVTIKIDKSVTGESSEDGEIVAYGPIVMQGYYKNEEATKAVMTEDGGLRTGDLGHFDKDGYLYITGRIKEQYKLINGKYVYPASIEEDIKMLPYVENAMVYGENRDFNIALIVLDLKILSKWAEQAKLKTDLDKLAHSPVVQEFVSIEIHRHLKEKFGGYEIPKKYIFVDDPFSLENGLLTQTMKLKRNEVFKKYKEDIEQLY